MREDGSINEVAEMCANVLIANLNPAFAPSELPDAHDLVHGTVRIAIETALEACAGAKAQRNSACSGVRS